MDIMTIGLELEKIIPKEKIRYNEPMSKHTTFKTGGKADRGGGQKNLPLRLPTPTGPV